jgi:ABC-type molybdenum transport system, ATPase component/photorepair protein PhrA
LINYLAQLAKTGVTFIIIDDDIDIPEFITNIIWIDESKQIQKSRRENYVPIIDVKALSKTNLSNFKLPALMDKYTSIIKFENVTISYGAKIALNNVNWQVEPGQKWLLSGHNGAGKSTLLSLINGDHPQAYANEIYLFDRKRGSGESVWEIKQKIGLCFTRASLEF